MTSSVPHRSTRDPVLARCLGRAALGLVLLVMGLVGPAPTVAALPVSPPAALSPSSWPLAGEPEVVAGFDPPASTYGAGHRGVDLAGTAGATVFAVAAGTVSVARTVAGVPVVVVDHGELRSTYQPVTATVQVGARVAAGDPIGRLLTGGHCAERACLHWGVLRDQEYLDPLSVVAPQPAPLTLLPADAPRLTAERLRVRAVAAERASGTAQNAVALALATGPGAGPGRFGLVPPVSGPVSSPYGRRFHPVLHVWKLHDGTDFAAACGTPIRAPAAGRVTRRSSDGAYGNRLFLDHGTIDGTHVVTALNHAADYTVAVGATVRQGEVVGHVGATGYATGCHLHLMVWLDGRLVDPEPAL